MDGRILGDLPDGRRWLLVVAAPKEVLAVARGVQRGASLEHAGGAWRAAVLSDRLAMVVSGVGKANAAGGTASALARGRYAGVLSLGICGALPGGGVSLGDVVAADASVYADEGVLTPDGFADVASMGFSPGPAPAVGVRAPNHDAAWRGLSGLAGLAVRRGTIATVSTCSGTAAGAEEVVRRTGAIAEAMEGAAVGFTAARLAPDLPFCEVRVVSNTTGDRSSQRWDLGGALDRLGTIAGLL